MHQKRIIHQDLKPGNVMMTDDQKQVKIIDMGISHTLDQTFQATMSAQMGTPRYMAPEQSHDRLSFMSDIWSFGCVLLELCTGYQPYHGQDNHALCAQMETESPLDYAKRKFKSSEMDLIMNHRDLHDILRRCFIQDERKRPKAETIMREEFFKNNVVTWV